MAERTSTQATPSAIKGHTGAVQHVSASADGHCLASTSADDGTVRLWDQRLASGVRAVRCVRFRVDGAEDGGALSCACFGSREDELFLAHGATVHRWDLRASSAVVQDGAALPSVFVAPDEVNELAFNPGTPPMGTGSPLLAAADDTGAITVVQTSTNTVYRVLDKQHTNVCSFMPTRPHLAPHTFSTLPACLLRWNRFAARSSGTRQARGAL